MARYAVTARIDRPTLRVAGPARHRNGEDPGEQSRRSAAGPETEDLVGRPIELILRERWTDIRTSWGQLTFFLFDPDSWR